MQQSPAEEYSYLLGVYLGDGTLVRTHRPHAHRLEVYCDARYVSNDIQKIFCDACDAIGVNWRQDGPRNISIARRADVALLDTFIGPKR